MAARKGKAQPGKGAACRCAVAGYGAGGVGNATARRLHIGKGGMAARNGGALAGGVGGGGGLHSGRPLLAGAG